ncbi:MAG: arylsulfotransferase (ASST) [bacterium]|nr:arylsulfotransferase (ASST) [bacterium]
MRHDTALLHFAITGFLAPAALAQDGLTLYQPNTDTTTYLIDSTGAAFHSWPGTEQPGLSVYLLPGGDLIRTRHSATGLPGTGGGFERVTWDGTVTWQFDYETATETPHHDVAVLPNGNVLMIIWEEYTAAQAIAQGRNPNFVQSLLIPDKIVEVQQTGPTTGDFVWEWHAWDHLVQDYDSLLPNFGVIADHPELIDLNYPPGPPQNGDWMHSNSIDYNPEFDQIVLSVSFWNELWIIDHSTTTQEAAGHTGGDSGKGGDLLYRWGNGAAYDRAADLDRQLFFMHDINWIRPGRPGAGNLLLFNNGTARPGVGNFSSVDEVVTPVDAQGNYPSLAPGVPFGPTAAAWTYWDPVPDAFYTSIMGGTERLPNGNTLIIDSTEGRLFEVDQSGTVTWDYTNPHGTSTNWVFKARYVPDCRTPEPYCATVPNSAGPGVTISATGTTSLAANDLVFQMTGGIANNWGLFFYGEGQGMLPSGDGTICVGSNFFRFPTLQSNAAGMGSYAVDFGNLPSIGFEPFATWNFQYWYRDPIGGPEGWNFSHALAVTFCP